MTSAKDTRFKPGQSGNPAGRPAGAGFAGEVRDALRKAWAGEQKDGSDGVRHKLIELAKSGDLGAIRIIAERVCPPIKASEEPIAFPIEGETLTQRAHGVLAGLSAGALNPGQAAQLMQAIGALAKVVEVDELTRRIEALEEKSAKRA